MMEYMLCVLIVFAMKSRLLGLAAPCKRFDILEKSTILLCYFGLVLSIIQLLRNTQNVNNSWVFIAAVSVCLLLCILDMLADILAWVVNKPNVRIRSMDIRCVCCGLCLIWCVLYWVLQIIGVPLYETNDSANIACDICVAAGSVMIVQLLIKIVKQRRKHIRS